MLVVLSPKRVTRINRKSLSHQANATHGWLQDSHDERHVQRLLWRVWEVRQLGLAMGPTGRYTVQGLLDGPSDLLGARSLERDDTRSAAMGVFVIIQYYVLKLSIDIYKAHESEKPRKLHFLIEDWTCAYRSFTLTEHKSFIKVSC